MYASTQMGRYSSRLRVRLTPYMDAPGGARGVEEMVNLGRTACLYPACVWAVLLQPWW